MLLHEGEIDCTPEGNAFAFASAEVPALVTVMDSVLVGKGRKHGGDHGVPVFHAIANRIR